MLTQPAGIRQSGGECDQSGPSRKENGGCDYAAYVPDRLVGRTFRFDGEVAADVANAEAAITRLNLEATSLVDTEALARILLRAESVASSRIEGLQIGARQLLRAEAARGLGETPANAKAVEVLGNIDAMVCGIERIRTGMRSASNCFSRSIAVFSPEPDSRSTAGRSARSRTGSVAMITTRAARTSYRRHRSTFRTSSVTSSASATTTR
jgi:hypothetical protein